VEVDIEEYTNEKVRQHLLLLEEHLKDYGQSPLFCADCIRNKHILMLFGLISECKSAGCTLNPVYKEIEEHLNSLKETLPLLTEEKAIELAEETRRLRKKLELLAEKAGEEIHSTGHIES